MTRRQKLVAFGPAIVVIGLTAALATGWSLIPGAGAASTLTVGGTVSAGMSVNPDTATACAGTNSTSVGDFSDGAFHGSAANCTVSFATNSVNGANVTIDDADAIPFLCTGSCTAGSNNTVENVTAAAGGAALADDTFGVALVSVAGTPAPVAGANFKVDPSPASQTGGEAIWGPIDAAPANICQTSAVTTVTQSCTFGFGVDGQGATQTSGSYSGTANILATANP